MKLRTGLVAFYVPSGQDTDWTYSTAPGTSTGLYVCWTFCMFYQNLSFGIVCNVGSFDQVLSKDCNEV